MIWYDEGTVGNQMLYHQWFHTLKNVSLRDTDTSSPGNTDGRGLDSNPDLNIQTRILDLIRPFFRAADFVDQMLAASVDLDHIMYYSRNRAVWTLISMLNSAIKDILSYNECHVDFPLTDAIMEKYIVKKLILAVITSITGDLKHDQKDQVEKMVKSFRMTDFPPESICNYTVSVQSGEWISMSNRTTVPTLDYQQLFKSDTIIQTDDTLRNEALLTAFLSESRTLLLCGPPGCGKSMVILAALRKMPNVEVSIINFSSATTPKTLLQAMRHHCDYKKTPHGIILSPKNSGRLVLFCDEINLPDEDSYGTQRVISFIRQLVEQGGFWDTLDKSWVTLERIQFVGAWYVLYFNEFICL